MRKTPSAKPETRPTVASRKPAGMPAGNVSLPGRLSWSLPSGESLTEFALRFGFLAPPLLGGKRKVR
jgi:hypothetical protein